MKILQKILVGAWLIALSAGGYYLYTHQNVASFGATANPGANALYEQSLAQPLGTADASMFVTSGADVQGNLLSVGSYQCLSVDTGQPNFEAICGTVSSSSTAGLTLAIALRGLSTQTATTTNSSFIFTHRRGADVRITDFPALTILNNQLNGAQVIPNPIYYSSNFTPSFWTTAASSTIATLGIVNSTAASGCGNASEVANGCSQLATAAQAAAGTSLGSTGARIVIPGSLTNATQSSTTIVPVTNTSGKLSQLFLDLTQAFTFVGNVVTNGSLTANATTTISASNVLSNALVLHGLPYSWPNTRAASSTVLSEDGNGNLSFESPSSIVIHPYSLYSGTTVTANSGTTATSTASLTIPAGVLTASSTITAIVTPACTPGSNGSPACDWQLVTSKGVILAQASFSESASGPVSTGPLTFTVTPNNSLSSQEGCVTGIMAPWGQSSVPLSSQDTSNCASSAVNFANALTLTMNTKINTTSGGESQINQFQIIVNP